MCTTFSASAEEERIDTLREVVVTAARVRFSVISPTPSQTMRKEVLEKFNSLSVADATRYFSGAQLKDYGGIGGLKTVDIRNLGTMHTAVFYDGVQLGNAQNGQVDLGKFSLQNIEEVQLFNGQKSSIFQPARGLFASNSLYLVSKRPEFENRKFQGTASVKAGSFGLYNPSVYWAQQINPTLSYSVNGEWQQAKGNYKFTTTNGVNDTTNTRKNTDIEALRLEAALFGTINNSGRWAIKGYFYDSERGLPGVLLENDTSYQRQWDRNMFVQAFLQKSFGEKWETIFNIKYNHDYTRYLDPSTFLVSGHLDNRYTQQEFYASGVAQYNVSSWLNVSASADFIWNTLDANLPVFSYPGRYNILGALNAHLFFERIDIQVNLLGASIINYTKINESAPNRNQWCPVVSASWQPFAYNGFRLRGFYKKTFRMPTFNDLYYSSIGYSLLRPEFATQYDIGFTWNKNLSTFLQSLAIKFDAYYNQVDDKIIATPSKNLFRWTMMNLEKVVIQGLEFGIESGFRLGDWSSYFGINYTYQRAEDHTPNSSVYGHLIPYAPEHSGSALLSVNYQNWQFNYSFIYTGGRYALPDNSTINYIQPWYTSDIALSWQYEWKNTFIQNIKINAEINNLFNQNYDVIKYFPMPGRSFRCGISIGF